MSDARVHPEPAQPWRRVTGSRPSRLRGKPSDVLECGHAMKFTGREAEFRQCSRCKPELGVTLMSPAAPRGRTRRAEPPPIAAAPATAPQPVNQEAP